MKKLVSLVGGMLLVGGLSAAPSLAGTVFQASMFCKNGGGSGSARITTNGDVKIKVQGLEANTEFTCQLVCQCIGGHLVDEPCTTDATGRLNVTFPGAAAGVQCTCPSVEIFNDQDCISGFSLPQ